ncbi:MAG TPA: cytochrome c [Gammaproteobacteria bacterium]|nr:cytochrome c [Gammaproteobacteria bacterium]
MTRRQSIVAAVALTVLLAACEGQDGETVAQQKLLPPAGFVADANQGERLFRAHCARCHGQAGMGSDQGPPLVHSVYRPAHHADLAFYWAVKDGVRQHHWHFGDMPAIEGLAPEDVAHIIAYVRGEQRNNGIR